jgi:hypothetical protein
MTPNPAEVACFAIPGNENTSLRGRNVTGDVGRELSPHKGKVMCIPQPPTNIEIGLEIQHL